MKWDLCIDCEPHSLRAARAGFRGFLESSGFSCALIDPVVLAVDEACANVYRHAYRGSGGPLWIRARRRNGRLRVLLRDRGLPFDAAGLPERDLEEIRPGGLGLPIIKRVFDRVEYRPRRVGTLLILEKPFSGESTDARPS